MTYKPEDGPPTSLADAEQNVEYLREGRPFFSMRCFSTGIAPGDIGPNQRAVRALHWASAARYDPRAVFSKKQRSTYKISREVASLRCRPASKLIVNGKRRAPTFHHFDGLRGTELSGYKPRFDLISTTEGDPTVGFVGIAQIIEGSKKSHRVALREGDEYEHPFNEWALNMPGSVHRFPPNALGNRVINWVKSDMPMQDWDWSV